MDSMANFSGQQEEAERGKLRMMAGVLIAHAAVGVRIAYGNLLLAMETNSVFLKVFVVSAIVAFFTAAIVLVTTRPRGTQGTIVLIFLNSAVFGYASFLAALYSVMPPSWFFFCVSFVFVALIAFRLFLLIRRPAECVEFFCNMYR
ncbi:hypothetical protein SUGI_1007420 [Cryptomeria japonica]|nr:hypothetical protein SUGI_1007420 [Cryptomeria japonica]